MQLELNHYVDLLAIHRDALRILGKQLARFGNNAPTHKELEYINRLAECTRHICDSIELMKHDYTAETEALSVLSADLSERGLVYAMKIIQNVANSSGQPSNLLAKNSSGDMNGKPISMKKMFIEKIKKLVGNAETGEAIVSLIIYTKGKKIHDTALLLSGQYKRLKKEIDQGTITRQTFEADLSDLNNRLLKLAEEID